MLDALDEIRQIVWQITKQRSWPGGWERKLLVLWNALALATADTVYLPPSDSESEDHRFIPHLWDEREIEIYQRLLPRQMVVLILILSSFAVTSTQVGSVLLNATCLCCHPPPSSTCSGPVRASSTACCPQVAELVQAPR